MRKPKGKTKQVQPKTNASNPSMKDLLDRVPVGARKKK